MIGFLDFELIPVQRIQSSVYRVATERKTAEFTPLRLRGQIAVGQIHRLCIEPLASEQVHLA